MEAARPNLLIQGASAHEEDTWRRIRVSGIEIQVVKPWVHDVFVQPGDTAAYDDAVDALASYRGLGDGGALGQLAIHTATTGQIRIGDVVEVLERGEAPLAEEEVEPEPEDVVQDEAEADEEPESGGWFRRRKPGGTGKKVRMISLPDSEKPRGSSGDEDAELPWETPEDELRYRLAASYRLVRASLDEFVAKQSAWMSKQVQRCAGLRLSISAPASPAATPWKAGQPAIWTGQPIAGKNRKTWPRWPPSSPARRPALPIRRWSGPPTSWPSFMNVLDRWASGRPACISR